MDIKGFINGFKSLLNVASWLVRFNSPELQGIILGGIGCSVRSFLRE